MRAAWSKCLQGAARQRPMAGWRKNRPRPPGGRWAGADKNRAFTSAQECPGGLTSRRRARCWTSRMPTTCDHPDPKATRRRPRRFIFTGCGSERLFSQVGLATQAMLWQAGVQTVLPPGYLCCGYPQRGSGQFDKAEKIITDNRVLFHRVANTLNYLDIKTVVVSCGTCYDQLQGYRSTRSSRAADHRHPRIPAEKASRSHPGGAADAAAGGPLPRPCQPRAREPCRRGHSSDNVRRAPLLRESGTFGIHRPTRHTGAIPQGRGCARTRRACARQRSGKGAVKILTSCPSCRRGAALPCDLANGLLEPTTSSSEAARIIGETDAALRGAANDGGNRARARELPAGIR